MCASVRALRGAAAEGRVWTREGGKGIRGRVWQPGGRGRLIYAAGRYRARPFHRAGPILGHLARLQVAWSAAREFGPVRVTARSGVIGLRTARPGRRTGPWTTASVRRPVPARPGEMAWPGSGPRIYGQRAGPVRSVARPGYLGPPGQPDRATTGHGLGARPMDRSADHFAGLGRPLSPLPRAGP